MLSKNIDAAKADFLEVDQFLAAKELATTPIKSLSPPKAEVVARLTIGHTW